MCRVGCAAPLLHTWASERPQGSPLRSGPSLGPSWKCKPREECDLPACCEAQTGTLRAEGRVVLTCAGAAQGQKCGGPAVWGMEAAGACLR